MTSVILVAMKVAVSLPDPLFIEAEQVAKRLRLSRSKLYATALTRFVREHRSLNVTEQLNRVYRRGKSELDPVLDKLQARSLPSEKW